MDTLFKAVTLADVDTIKGEEAVKILSDEFGPNRVSFIKTDVTVEEEIVAALEETIDRYKNLDIIINNAGVMNDAIWKKEIAINFIAPVTICLLGIEKYLPKYKSGSEAVIVNVSSILGLIPHGALPVYTATKHGIIGLSKAFGIPEHYDRTKVRILTICPGATDTPLITESANRNLGEAYEKIRAFELSRTAIQPPEAVAEALVKAIEEGENGSIWAIDDGITSKVNLPDLQSLLTR